MEVCYIKKTTLFKSSTPIASFDLMCYILPEMENNTIGNRLRTLRKDRRFSLEKLAGKSGVALATLSRIENGKGSGTFKTHLRIAEAFGLSLPELYQGLRPLDQDAVLVDTRTEEAETFTFDQKASSVLLAKQLSGKQMLPQMIILQPGGKTTLEQYTAGTERWVFCLEGAVSVSIGDTGYRLGAEGTLYFKASLQHRFENTGTAPAKLISVTSPITF